MAGTAEKTDPKLWDRVKKRVTQSSKGGNAGQWSARKAQLATAEYKKAGGGYRGKKAGDNHLTQWTHEEWGTKSGRKSADSGERYLPKKARSRLSKTEYERTTRKKQADSRKGKQFSRQPADVARKTSQDRDTGRKPATRKAETGSSRTTATTRTATTRTVTRKNAGDKSAANKGAARQASARSTSPRKNSARKTAAGKSDAPRSKAAQPARRGSLETLSRAQLLERAARQSIPNRARMRKAELIAVLKRSKR